MSIQELLDAALVIISDLGLLPIVFLSAIIFVAVVLFARFKSAALGAGDDHGGLSEREMNDVIFKDSDLDGMED